MGCRLVRSTAKAVPGKKKKEKSKLDVSLARPPNPNYKLASSGKPVNRRDSKWFYTHEYICHVRFRSVYAGVERHDLSREGRDDTY